MSRPPGAQERTECGAEVQQLLSLDVLEDVQSEDAVEGPGVPRGPQSEIRNGDKLRLDRTRRGRRLTWRELDVRRDDPLRDRREARQQDPGAGPEVEDRRIRLEIGEPDRGVEALPEQPADQRIAVRVRRHRHLGAIRRRERHGRGSQLRGRDPYRRHARHPRTGSARGDQRTGCIPTTSLPSRHRRRPSPHRSRRLERENPR